MTARGSIAIGGARAKRGGVTPSAPAWNIRGYYSLISFLMYRARQSNILGHIVTRGTHIKAAEFSSVYRYCPVGRGCRPLDDSFFAISRLRRKGSHSLWTGSWDYPSHSVDNTYPSAGSASHNPFTAGLRNEEGTGAFYTWRRCLCIHSDRPYPVRLRSQD